MAVLLTLITRADCCLCDEMKAIVFLFADVGETQLVRVEKFDDTALQRHGYNCGT